MARRKKLDSTNMITGPARMAAWMIGFPESRVLDVDEDPAGVHVEVETADDEACCGTCGESATLDGRSVVVVHPDGLLFGRPCDLSWQLRRWRCPTAGCPGGLWTEEVPSVSAHREAPKK
jgi:hypothetical protein